MISFAAVVLLIASMTKSCASWFKDEINIIEALNGSRTVEVGLTSSGYLYL